MSDSMKDVWARRMTPYVKACNRKQLASVLNLLGVKTTGDDPVPVMAADVIEYIRRGEIEPGAIYAAVEFIDPIPGGRK